MTFQGSTCMRTPEEHCQYRGLPSTSPCISVVLMCSHIGCLYQFKVGAPAVKCGSVRFLIGCLDLMPVHCMQSKNRVPFSRDWYVLGAASTFVRGNASISTGGAEKTPAPGFQSRQRNPQ